MRKSELKDCELKPHFPWYALHENQPLPFTFNRTLNAPNFFCIAFRLDPIALRPFNNSIRNLKSEIVDPASRNACAAPHNFYPSFLTPET